MMDQRTLKSRLEDPEYVKHWYDQIGFEGSSRIAELEETLREARRLLTEPRDDYKAQMEINEPEHGIENNEYQIAESYLRSYNNLIERIDNILA